MPDVNQDSIIKILSTPTDRNKPWMTAEGLSKRLYGNESRAEAIEKCLMKYLDACASQRRRPKVRYATLPSKKTLRVLWGYTLFVKHREIHGIRKNDLADDSLETVAKDRKNPPDFSDGIDVFLSHSFKDYPEVIDIALALQQKKLRPWLAETHIQKDEHINNAVIAAMQKGQCFAVFLTSNALKSKWTGKEFYYAKRDCKPIIAICDCRNTVIRKLVEKHLSGSNNLSSTISGALGEFFEALLKHDGNVHFIVYPEAGVMDLSLTRRAKNVHPYSELATLIADLNSKFK